MTFSRTFYRSKFISFYDWLNSALGHIGKIRHITATRIIFIRPFYHCWEKIDWNKDIYKVFFKVPNFQGFCRIIYSHQSKFKTWKVLFENDNFLRKTLKQQRNDKVRLRSLHFKLGLPLFRQNIVSAYILIFLLP